MEAKKSFPLSEAAGKREALVYYGHLLAQAESELQCQTASIEALSLTWITGELISRGGRVHTLTVESLKVGEERLGDWTLTARILDDKIRQIEIFRHEFLARDGKTVVELAMPFLTEGSKNDLEAFCVGQLALKATQQEVSRASYVLRDSTGHEAHLSLRRKLGSLKDPSAPPSLLRNGARLLSGLKRTPNI